MTVESKIELTPGQIHDLVSKVTADQLGKQPQELRPEARLMQDLGADSLDVVELSMELETQLGVTIPEELMDNKELTLGELEEALQRLLR